MKKKYIYMIGIGCLGLAYAYIEKVLGGGTLFVLVMLATVVLISGLAHLFGK